MNRIKKRGGERALVLSSEGNRRDDRQDIPNAGGKKKITAPSLTLTPARTF